MNVLIVKANSILRALTVLGLEEHRVFNFCLQYYDSRKNASNPSYFDISINKLRDTYPAYKNYNHSALLDICEKVMLEIMGSPYQPDLKVKEWIAWFDKLEVIDRTSGGYIRFRLTPAAMPYFLELREHFISYHMTDVNLLKKQTAYNLYEYVKENYQKGQIPEWVETVDDLRKRLIVTKERPRQVKEQTARCAKERTARRG